MKLSADIIIEDIKLPDYKGRHVFLAKLRLSIFIAFWVVGIFYFKTLWKQAPWVPLVISVAFLLTGICYQNILKNRALMFFFMMEIALDMLSATVVVYITGGVKSEYYILYIMYCVAAGMFYNYQVAIVAAIFSLLFYGILLLSLHFGWISPFEFTPTGGWFGPFSWAQYFRFFLLLLFLPIAIYGVKISNFFSRLKERALEQRNKQLVALNRISSTIRRVMKPSEVLQQVFAGVMEGLGYDVCLLVMPNRETGAIEFFNPKHNTLIEMIEARIGFKLSEMYLPPGIQNSIFTAIVRNRLVFRQELSELVNGVEPPWSKQLADEVQKEMGFKKFVIMPLVAERRVMGALIGISKTEFVDENRISVLENFSNQAALAIESAQLVEELQNKNILLERANRTKSEFLAIMSHELRTPLTAIIGFSELLLEGAMGEVNKDQAESLRDVIRNGQHLLHLINSILDLSKVEAGKMELNLDTISLEEVIQDVKTSVAPLINKKQQNFVIDIEEMPVVVADARKMRQILLNLLSNAIKFTPETGRITLRVRHFVRLAEDLRVKGAALPESPKGYFEIVVQDTGIGIDEKDLQTVFNVFEQVDSSFTRKYQGTGLGLALTKQFVEMHQGVIWVTSQKGRGSTFHILLPVEAPLREESGSAQTAEPLSIGLKSSLQGQ